MENGLKMLTSTRKNASILPVPKLHVTVVNYFETASFVQVAINVGTVQLMVRSAINASEKIILVDDADKKLTTYVMTKTTLLSPLMTVIFTWKVLLYMTLMLSQITKKLLKSIQLAVILQQDTGL